MVRNSVVEMPIHSPAGIKLHASLVELLLTKSSAMSLLRDSDNALIREDRGLKGIAQADTRFYLLCASAPCRRSATSDYSLL